MTDRRNLFGLVASKDFTPLPLKDVAVGVEINGFVLGMKSTLKYENATEAPLEVVFRFPLEKSHAVVGLTALVGGRRIRAEVKGKEEAKAQYDDAIAGGQTAAYAEEKAGDIFSVSLGNLPPKNEAEIILELVGELPIDAEGSVRFSLPATLKPRYVPAGSTDPLEKVGGAGSIDEQIKQASVSSVEKFKLTILNQDDIAEVTSPTHSVRVERDADKVTAVLSGEDQSLAKDLVMLIKHKLPHTPKALVEKGIEDGKEFMKQVAVMVNFFPEFHTGVEMKCEFIFLVDRSGSMSGSYIACARETLLLFLKSLPEGCYFNIVGFGSRYVKLFNKSVLYAQKSLDKATSHAESMQADLGGTELLPPLKDIFNQKVASRGMTRQVFVLTDGAVSNTRACIDVVRQNVVHSRCFTFGIGDGASSELVEGLARAGNGSAEFIKSGERMQPKVIRSLKRAIQPAVTDVSVHFKVKSPNTKAAYQSPEKLPPIFAGEKLVVYGLMNLQDKSGQTINGDAILKGSMLGKPFEHCVPFNSNLDSCAESDGIYPVHRLAAKALISDWQDSRKPKESIVSLSMESSVVSEHTAFIAVDEENLNPIEGSMQTWDIKSDDLFCMAAPSLGGGGGFFSGILVGEKSKKNFYSSGAPPPPPCGALRNAGISLYSSAAPLGSLSYPPPPPPGGAFMSRSRIAKSAAPMGSRSVPLSCPHVPCDYAMSVSTPTHPTDVLSSIVAAQQADGSWKLNSSLAQILSKRAQEVESVCPVELKGDVIDMIWATVLVLTLLEKKCASQQDEWELIALKARSWLKKQPLPSGVEMDLFYTAAQTLM